MSEAQYIYFVQAGGGPIKIGTSRNPLRRLVKMQADNHEPLTLLAVLHGDEAREREIQKQFWSTQVRGEWFSPGTELLAFIRDHAVAPAFANLAGLTTIQSQVLVAVADNKWLSWKAPNGRCAFVSTVSRLRERGLVEHNTAGLGTRGLRRPSWIYRLTATGQHLLEAARASA